MRAPVIAILGLAIGLGAAATGVSCAVPENNSHAADWPLEGRHATATCASCHGDYPTPFEEIRGIECVDCHLATLEAELEARPGWIHTWRDNCEGCHTAGLDWEQATMGPHIFPRQHGTAGGACNACHDEPATATNFECVQCHHSDLNELRDDHNDVPNYEPVSASCVSSGCHPNGQEP